MTEQVDDQDVHGVRGEEMCASEVTQEDMLHELFEHKEHGHDEDSGGVIFLGKGNGSLPWSDKEEWESGESGSGGSGRMRGPGWSEDWRRSGSGPRSGSGSEMPVRKVGSGVEGVCEAVSTACGRLANIPYCTLRALATRFL